jgi:farnesyl diphosphate synthase
MTAADEFGSKLSKFAERFDGEIARRFGEEGGDQLPQIRILWDAIAYVLKGKGKRFRPYLLTKTVELFRGSDGNIPNAALAIEYVHCFSLVHDDLPALDNDDLRHGRPTVHRKYDEATAVLVGDSLLALAFQALANGTSPPNSETTCRLIACLADAIGPTGMIGGQMLDLYPRDGDRDAREYVSQMHRRKTGALIACAAEMGAIVGGANNADCLNLREFGYDLGEIFQMADDLIDSTGDELLAGKRLQKDEQQGKATLTGVLSVEHLRAEIDTRIELAIDRLRTFGSRAETLVAATYFAGRRNR